jgi:hypothetical protein
MRRPRSSPAFSAALTSCALLLATACSDDAQFTTRFASDFAPARHSVSVLGVFKDGQMSSEAWESIGPKLSLPFGATCDTAYTALVSTNQPLSSAIDDYVRANGPGDELLEQLAPAATGDVILVFTVAGHVTGKPASTPDTSTVSGAPAGSNQTMGGGGGKYRGMRPGGVNGGRGMARAAPVAAFEVSASLYSVSQKRAVGFVAMQYDGPTMDDALQRMATRLGVALPSSRCGGWDWKAKVDDGRIRALTEP